MATTWNLDPTHSEVTFKVSHLMINNVSGTIGTIGGTLTADDHFGNVSAPFEADLSTISTGNEQRDGQLKGGDFFEVEKFPKITFVGNNALNAKSGKAQGTLTIKGVSKEVEFDLEFHGENKDPWGNQKVGFTAEGKINRTDFGLNWNVALETGGVLVSEEVKLVAELQFVKA